MGGSSSSAKSGLKEARERASARVGHSTVSGRYHRLPKRIEDEYNLEKQVLGTGYNGSVVLATGRESGQKYAVKGFHLHGVGREKMEELESEAEIFLSMDHPHVARLVAVFEDDKMLNLVMECMEGGEVYERVLRIRRFSENDAACTLHQMLLSVNYIHSQNIVHRDLKLENFLYEKKDGNHLKLIDFGFSKVWERNTKMDLSCGTLSYVAPEVLKQSYTSQCDLWSLGVIAFILLLGYMPFAGGDEDRQKDSIKAGKFTRKADKWARISAKSRSFIEQLLVVDTKVRLTAEQALQHPFIVEYTRPNDGEGGVDTGVAEALVSFAEASQFRRACMSVMAWSLTNEERTKVRDAFLKIDKNNQGTITLSELREVLMTEFHLEDQTAQDIFKALDTAKNDEIHYSEFLAAMVSTRINMHDSLLTATFRKFDVDNSGYISLEDLKHVLGDSFDGAEVDRLANEADSNKDGQISYDEFISFLKDGEASAEHQEAAGKIIDNAHKDEDLVKGAGGTVRAHQPEGHLGLKAKSEGTKEIQMEAAPPMQQAAAAPSQQEVRRQADPAAAPAAPAGDAGNGKPEAVRSKTCVLL